MTSIGFGTWSWGNKLLWGYKSEKHDDLLEETFQTAIEEGLTLIDTADSYGTGRQKGKSEELLGRFINNLPSSKKKHITLATKLAPFPWRIGRKGLHQAFFESKARLKGKLNRVQLHWSTYKYAPWQEIQLIDGLGDLLEKGHIFEIGLSNIGPNRLMYIYKRLIKRKIRIKSIQVQLSLLSPQIDKYFILKEICNELGIEILAYSPLAFGLLTLPPNIDGISSTLLRESIYKRLLPSSKEIRSKIEQISNSRDVSRSQVALNWCRSHGAIPIPGIRTPIQAKEAASAKKWELSETEVYELDKLSKACKIKMPNNPFQSD
ncbi:aldo/keto reductase [Prochlorococcus sp. MIT 1223]|uniref:aldo/keto reductase n=1 Tax=Prochlorococcus sp. MIT 1223 TaxID=3096217 RepID=UPI002A74E492|nr:aldo/keto reductase [Prochlorococcus sp. MIT 1223]